MRTLSEIIDAAKDGSETTHEECLYALLAYSALHYFDNHAIARMAEKPDSKFFTPAREHEESFRRFKTALGKSPKDYVGWNNDPKNPEHVRFVKMGRKLVDKIASGVTILVLLALWPALACAQTAPLVGTTVRTTSTAVDSIKSGCTQTGPCTGGIKAGPVDVASVTSAGFIEIANNVPGSQTFRLVNNAGTLQWNGIPLATGSSVSGTLNTIAVFTGASSIGNSIMTQSGTTITVANTLNATTLGGTLSTATQNSVTTMTGLTTVGTIGTGVWNATIIGLAKGGTGADLSGTGGTSQFLRQNTVGGTVTVVRPAISDLSDASNVALLNAANTFTVASGIQMIQPSTATNSAAWQFINTGGTNFVGADNSVASQGSGAAYSLFLLGGSTGGIALRANDAAGALRIYTGGGNLRWGVNAAGDWTFGSSSHIADSVGTPTIASGFGTSPSITGTDYAFKVTNGSPSGNGVVNFGHTWSTAPICVLSTANIAGAASAQTVAGLSTTTTLTISYSAGGDANGLTNVVCRSY